jgi:hypothetical protein
MSKQPTREEIQDRIEYFEGLMKYGYRIHICSLFAKMGMPVPEWAWDLNATFSDDDSDTSMEDADSETSDSESSDSGSSDHTESNDIEMDTELSDVDVDADDGDDNDNDNMDLDINPNIDHCDDFAFDPDLDLDSNLLVYYVMGRDYSAGVNLMKVALKQLQQLKAYEDQLQEDNQTETTEPSNVFYFDSEYERPSPRQVLMKKQLAHQKVLPRPGLRRSPRRHRATAAH